jgi:hypothetical protein
LINDVEGIKEQRRKLKDEKTTLQIQVSEHEHALKQAHMLQEGLVQQILNCMDVIKRLQKNRPMAVQVIKENALEDRLSDSDGEAQAEAEATYDEKYMLAKESAWLMIEKELEQSEKGNIHQQWADGLFGVPSGLRQSRLLVYVL